MKELTIEQKAKAYDEALKVLHKYDGANIMFTQDLKEEMFPELKEEGDEKIRKAIIEYFAGSHSSMYPYKGFTKEQIITWLEKQGEQKPIEREEFISIPFGTDSELIEEIIRIPKGYVATIEGQKVYIKKK